MQTMEQPGYRIEDARARLWFGGSPAWGQVVRGVDPGSARDAAGMIAAAGLDWRVEQHPLEAVIDGEALRVRVPRHVANVRSDTRDVLGVVGESYTPLQNRAAFAFCDGITDSGEAQLTIDRTTTRLALQETGESGAGFELQLFERYKSLPEPKGLVIILFSHGNSAAGLLEAALDGLPRAIRRMQADSNNRTRFEYGNLGYTLEPPVATKPVAESK